MLWCGLPVGVLAGHWSSAAEAHGVRLAPGPRFGTGHAFDDRLRLPYTHPPERAAAGGGAAGARRADVEHGARPDEGGRAPSDPVV